MTEILVIILLFFALVALLPGRKLKAEKLDRQETELVERFEPAARAEHIERTERAKKSGDAQIDSFDAKTPFFERCLVCSLKACDIEALKRSFDQAGGSPDEFSTENEPAAWERSLLSLETLRLARAPRPETKNSLTSVLFVTLEENLVVYKEVFLLEGGALVVKRFLTFFEGGFAVVTMVKDVQDLVKDESASSINELNAALETHVAKIRDISGRGFMPSSVTASEYRKKAETLYFG
jgi:hypothetical protein